MLLFNSSIFVRIFKKLFQFHSFVAQVVISRITLTADSDSNTESDGKLANPCGKHQVTTDHEVDDLKPIAHVPDNKTTHVRVIPSQLELPRKFKKSQN